MFSIFNKYFISFNLEKQILSKKHIIQLLEITQKIYSFANVIL